MVTMIVSRAMTRTSFNRAIAILLFSSLLLRWTSALPFQDIAGGASAFQGQDIMGGAAVIFKRPQRVRDLVSGSALAIVKKSRPVVHRTEPTEVARNPKKPKPGETEPKLSDADKGEAFRNQ